MNIESGYVIEEKKEKWKVSKQEEKVSVTYDISKEICKTREDVLEYIQKHIRKD